MRTTGETPKRTSAWAPNSLPSVAVSCKFCPSSATNFPIKILAGKVAAAKFNATKVGATYVCVYGNCNKSGEKFCILYMKIV